MRRCNLVTWTLALCLLSALHPSHSIPNAGVKEERDSRALSQSEGLSQQHHRQQQQQPFAGLASLLRANRRWRRAALPHPAEDLFSPVDGSGQHKGAEMMKRALSLWATLHPIKSNIREASQRRHSPNAAFPEGEAPLRPIGSQPLRWGR